jgi:hypothetical protein
MLEKNIIMKHLKTYTKLFEISLNDRNNDTEIREYLNDVFLEITDEGYVVDIDWVGIRTVTTKNQTGYKITIKNGKRNIDDIILPLEHAIGYLTDIFPRYWIDIYFGFNFPTFTNRLDDTRELEKYKNYNFGEIVINFRK